MNTLPVSFVSAIVLTLSSVPALAGEAASPRLADGATMVGVIVSREAADIAAESSGRLMAVAFDLGDTVSRGDTLATLDANAVRHQLASARAALQASQAEYRSAELSAEEARDRHQRRSQVTDAWTEEELNQVRLQADRADADRDMIGAEVAGHVARVRELEVQLQATVIRAPFDGVVALRYVDPGSFIGAGGAIVRLISVGELRIRFAVPESHVGEARIDRSIQVEVEVLDRAIPGVIDSVSPELDTASGMLIVEAVLMIPEDLAPLVRSGMAARVAFTDAG